MAKHRSPDRTWPWLVAAAGLAFAVTAAAWVDHITSRGTVVAQNVVFNGTDVSGLTLAEATRVVQARMSQVLATPVLIDTGAGLADFAAGDLGFHYDSSSVVSTMMWARHDGDPLERLVAWASSPLKPVQVDDVVRLDPGRAMATLADDDRMVPVDPVEPLITSQGSSEIRVIPGEDGSALDLDDLVDKLRATSVTSGSVQLQGARVLASPSVTDQQAEALGAQLNELTKDGIEVFVGQARVSLSPGRVRQHIHAEAQDGEIEVTVDTAGLHLALERTLTRPVGPHTNPTFEVVDDEVTVVSLGEPPPVCCDPDSVQVMAELLQTGNAGPFWVDSRTSTEPQHVAWAEGRDVVEKVGEFTTRYNCCESRVTNIHLIADLTRGAYLLPGETLSLNQHVGERTRERGFVGGGAIRAGRLQSEVGGGVSQFATTIFNAAFFAGLDFIEYQSHSIYFSRYPYGREATISSPAPDLVLANNTDYPVLIWTSYDATSVTVSMYSTQHIEVEQVAQRRFPRNRCTYVETDRQRVYPDGSVVIDTVEANYRPGEGLDCQGRPLPRS